MSEEQQLQVDDMKQHIVALTHQNQLLQWEHFQLLTANTDLLQKAAVLQHECNTLNVKNEELCAGL